MLFLYFSVVLCFPYLKSVMGDSIFFINPPRWINYTGGPINVSLGYDFVATKDLTIEIVDFVQVEQSRGSVKRLGFFGNGTGEYDVSMTADSFPITTAYPIGRKIILRASAAEVGIADLTTSTNMTLDTCTSTAVISPCPVPNGTICTNITQCSVPPPKKQHYDIEAGSIGLAYWQFGIIMAVIGVLFIIGVIFCGYKCKQRHESWTSHLHKSNQNAEMSSLY